MGVLPIAAGGGGFTTVDGVVLGAYFLILAGSGIWFSRKKLENTEDYFLGGRKMPVWAVAISIVATSMSAASFIGVPGASYNGNLTYLATNIGMILAALVIAFVFIPAFYKSRVQTIYGVLEIRYGPGAKLAASLAFMLGRVLASGARIYIGAIPASMLLFGVQQGLDTRNLILAISAMTAVGIGYTFIGGVASVIWSDVLQMGILLGACVAAVVLILLRLEAPIGEVFTAFSTGAPNQASKLTVLDWRLDPSLPYAVLTCFIGFTLMGIGSYGTDQDLAQRMLTCQDAKAGARSVIVGIVLGIPSVALFLVVGLLLWVFYQRPELFGANAPTQAPGDERQVFLEFILTQMPSGLTGLMMAGLFAAGLSSLNSAINAMSSTFIADIYRPLRPGQTEQHYLKMGRLGVLGWGLVLGAFACVCVFWQRQYSDDIDGGALLSFALGVMTFAYAGLIAVFFSALFTTRGSSASVIAALVTGFLLVLLMQPMFWSNFMDLEQRAARALQSQRPDPLGWVLALNFTWKLTLGVLISFIVCQMGSQPPKLGEDQAPDAETAAPNAAK